MAIFFVGGIAVNKLTLLTVQELVNKVDNEVKKFNNLVDKVNMVKYNKTLDYSLFY